MSPLSDTNRARGSWLEEADMVTRWIVLAVATTVTATVAEAGVNLVYTPTDRVHKNRVCLVPAADY